MPTVFLPGSGADDPHAGHAQGNGQIVGQAGDAAQSQAGLQLHLELGDDRTGLDLHHADVETEVEEGLLQNLRLPPHLLLLLVVAHGFAGQQQVDRGQLVVRRTLAQVGFVHLFEDRLLAPSVSAG